MKEFIRTVFLGLCFGLGAYEGIKEFEQYRLDSKVDNLIEGKNQLLDSLEDCRKEKYGDRREDYVNDLQMGNGRDNSIREIR